MLVVPALVVAGLYDYTPSFPVTITIEDPDGCGGVVTPVGRHTVKKGDDLIITVTPGNCGLWKGRVLDYEETLLYEVSDVKAGKVRLAQLAEPQNIIVMFTRMEE